VRVIEQADALRAAIRAFVRDGDLDLRTLADELAVGRSTLYRLVGNRDLLLGDVLWELARRSLVVSMREARDAGLTGLELLMTGSTATGHRIRGFAPLQQLLRTDPTTAFRVLFTPDGRVHERMVAWWTEAFTRAVADGHLAADVDAGKLAYVHVRIGESMLYADLLAGRDADLELAETIQRAVLGLSDAAALRRR
jgi:hypothetical protein